MKKILLVDDMESVRGLVAATLEGGGYEVVQAGDGDVALEIIKQQRDFALVISDVNMPHRDGISLTAELRKLPDFKFVPILLLTTESGRKKNMEGRAAGATGWLVKPVDPKTFLNKIAKVLK
ncbi:MAG: response regulator [Mariprofundus sp.]|nr:response regulator [Mariprofundus sp.]